MLRKHDNKLQTGKGFKVKRLIDFADSYIKPEREWDARWQWLELWEQENPNPNQPGEGTENFEDWYALHKAMQDRIWVAQCFPQYEVFDWSDEDVAIARELVSRHTCGVCGRNDDPGCAVGC